MADVFTNDLRIREQEVGANSGQWGSLLNVSLENIAESWSYGTEALADSAAQTLTLADGASDQLRSFYVKLTGTLSQATTVTIAPNTISKSWMIENATTGGYAVTISQGSGANVTVSNGNVKMVATDGAGAGAVVYDLFTDLELPGGLTVSGGMVLVGGVTNTAGGYTFKVGGSDNQGEIAFSANATAADLLSYDRTNSHYNTLNIHASSTIFTQGAITSNTLNSASGNDLRLNAGSANRDIFFQVNASTIATIKGSTNGFYLGTTASRVTSGVTPNFVIEGTSYNTNSIGVFTNANGVLDSPAMFFGKSRGTSVGSNTIVQNNDRLFTMRIDGSDGTNLEQAAIIEAYVDGSPAANSIPGRLSFMTTNAGSQYSTEKMRVRSDGNVGIGSVGMAAYAGYTQLSLGQMAHAMANTTESASGSLNISLNAHFDTDGSWETMVTGLASNYYQYNGEHHFRVAPSTSAGTDITWTEALVIDTNSFVSIGNTVASTLNAHSGYADICAGKGAGDNAGITLYSGTSHGGAIAFADGTSGTDTYRGLIQYSHASDLLGFYTSATNRMQINSTGSIGAPTGTNIYNASDKRLKQNISSLTGDSLKIINSLNPVKFNWIDNFVESENDKTLYGFVAQEVQEVFADAVESFGGQQTITVEDQTIENPLSVREKFLIPHLVKAIQEQQTLIETLQTKVKALEEA